LDLVPRRKWPKRLQAFVANRLPSSSGRLSINIRIDDRSAWGHSAKDRGRQTGTDEKIAVSVLFKKSAAEVRIVLGRAVGHLSNLRRTPRPQTPNDRLWRVSDHRHDAGGRQLELDLLGHVKSVVYFNPEISNSALQLRVAEHILRLNLRH
jgi:hypothetical protein